MGVWTLVPLVVFFVMMAGSVFAHDRQPPTVWGFSVEFSTTVHASHVPCSVLNLNSPHSRFRSALIALSSGGGSWLHAEGIDNIGNG